MSNNNIITFDVETTGIDPQRDQIIELCLQIGFETNTALKTWRIRPSVPISPAAFKVHGISVDDLKNCPAFCDVASEILPYFHNAKAIIGYNLEFDLSFLQAELTRNKLDTIDLKKINLVDPLLIWRKCEPRNLSAAYLRFAGKELIGAHSAEADVVAAAEVLSGMIKQFDLEDGNWTTLAELSGLNRTSWIGPTYHLQFRENEIVFGFGKFRNRSIVEVANSEDKGYLQWIIQKEDFPPHLKKVLSEGPLSNGSALAQWVSENIK